MASQFIQPWIQVSEELIEEFIQRLRLLQYNCCIIENMSFTTVKRIQSTMPINNPFKIFNRKTLESSKRNPSDIDYLRRENDFISYHATTPELTKWACQDQRIDALQFPLNDIHQLADDSTIILAKENDKSIEIEYNAILSNKYPISFLRNIKKVVYRAVKKELPKLFSSKAQIVEQLRSRSSLEGFLEFIGMPDSYYKEISQSWLVTRLERNRLRKKEEFIAPGIWLKEQQENQS